MVSALDDVVGNLSDALKVSDQALNTIIVFTPDNGAPFGDAMWEGDDKASALASSVGYLDAKRPPAGSGVPPHGGGGGSNFPYSGWKHWVFEGGVRSAAFVWYPPLNAVAGGGWHDGLMHSTDWLPTLVGLAEGSITRNLPLDGFDLMPALMRGGTASPRTELPVNIAACGADAKGVQSIINGPQAAIIVKDLKLIVPCFWRSARDLSGAALFNLTADAAEEHDLASKRPHDVARLAARLRTGRHRASSRTRRMPSTQVAAKGSHTVRLPRGRRGASLPWC